MKKIKTIYIYIYKCLDSKIENSIPKAIPSIPNTQRMIKDRKCHTCNPNNS